MAQAPLVTDAQPEEPAYTAALSAMPDLAAQEQADAEDAAQRQSKQLLDGLGQYLQEDIDRRKADRLTIEMRWLADMEQYNSIYDGQTAKALEASASASKVFIPLTRRICNIVEARLGDLLFPTDDRNFVVEHSPVPELAAAKALAAKIPADQMVDTPDGPTSAGTIAASIRDTLEEAAAKAVAMQKQIDDRLQERNYAGVSRQAINQGIVYGTGVIKGPMVLGEITKKFMAAPDGTASLQVREDLTPRAVWVDVWDFFPDLAARDMADSKSNFERHWLSKADLAKLVGQPGFLEDQIREVLKQPPGEGRTAETNQNALRSHAGSRAARRNEYCVWEYHGSVDTEVLIAAGVDVPDPELSVYEGVVWFVDGGQVIKAIINPMDTDAQPYSVFNWQKDGSCIFGYGMPYELRDMQVSANSSIRAALDNNGASAKPQVIMNRQKVRPTNGRWELEPGKMWEAEPDVMNLQTEALSFVNIPNNAKIFLEVFGMMKQLMDEVGGPMLAMQGQDAPNFLQTATGSSIAYNAATVWMRRAVRLWDDGITVPLISRFVDWEMQYNDDPKIKGDCKVIARGTSGLVEAEGQVQRLSMFRQLAQGVPMPLKRQIAQLREIAVALRLDPDKVLPDEEEIKKLEEAERKQAEQGPPMDPAMARIKVRELEIADKDKQRQHEASQADQNMQMRMAELASKENLTAEQAQDKYLTSMATLEANLADKKEARAHDAQKFNAEAELRMTTGQGV